jgi:hypothetical protein
VSAKATGKLKVDVGAVKVVEINEKTVTLLFNNMTTVLAKGDSLVLEVDFDLVGE